MTSLNSFVAREVLNVCALVSGMGEDISVDGDSCFSYLKILSLIILIKGVEAVCPSLNAPVNGSVNVGGVNEGDTAAYTCDDGYSLVGTNFRTCQSNAWTNTAPTCNFVGSNCLAGQHYLDSSTCTDCLSGTYCPTDGLMGPIDCPAGSKCPGTAETSHTLCDKGEYQPNEGQDSCIACDSGYYCDQTGLTDQVICPAGSMCPNTDESPTPCPSGKFHPNPGQVTCLDCITGYSCPIPGLTAPVVCPVDYRCPGIGNILPIPCNGHTCQPWTGREICIVSKGYYGTTDTPTRCPVGHYCVYGEKIKCPTGSFEADEISYECDNCTVGYYCEIEGLSSETRDCWLGHYCPEGASIPTPCPDGYYQSATGRSTCDICPVGYYCNQTEAENDGEGESGKPTHGVVTPKACFPNMCLDPGSTNLLTYTCVYDPFATGDLLLNISCKPSCDKYMTSLTDLKFSVHCDGCQNDVSTYQWSHRECFNENIQECVHCSFNGEMFLDSATGNYAIISHKNIKPYTYHAAVVKVTLNDGQVGMTSLIWQYYDDANVLCEISPVLGLAMTTVFTVTCTEPSLQEVIPYVCSMYYAFATSGDTIIFMGNDTCNHTGIALRQGDKEKDYRQHLNVVGKYNDHLLWDVPLILKVELPPVTNEELGNTIDELSGNLSESSSTEEIVDVLNELQAVSFVLNDKPPDENLTNVDNISDEDLEQVVKEENRKIREAVLETITKVDTSNIEIMVAVTSTLNQVTLKKDELSTESKDQAFEMYNTFTENFVEIEESTSDDDVTKAAQSLLFGVGTVLDMTTDDYIEDDVESEHDVGTSVDVTSSKPITEEDKEENKKRVIEKTEKLLKTVETISAIVFKRQSVDSEPAVFETPVMKIAIAKVSPKNLVGKPIKATGDNEDDADAATNLILPENLQLPEISNTSAGDDSIQTEFLLLKKNPFVWGKNSKDIKPPIVSFELKNSNKDVLHVANLSTPIRIQLTLGDDELAGTIQFLFTFVKVNDTIQLKRSIHRPCAATFELTVKQSRVTAFSLSLPDNFTALLSINLTSKFELLSTNESNKGFRYPKDIPIISKFYGHLSDIEAEIFDNVTLYCKACSEICCNTAGICNGFYEHCMYYCKNVLKNPFTENCTGLIDASVYCDSCQSECCDVSVNCTNVLENCVFFCAMHMKDNIKSKCQTYLSDSYAQALNLTLKTYCEDCDFYCCYNNGSESCLDIYVNCIYFCSHFVSDEVTLSCQSENKSEESIIIFPRQSGEDESYNMYFRLSVDDTDQQVLDRFKELDPDCLGNIFLNICTADIDIQVPLKVLTIGCDFWDTENELWATDGMQISRESEGNVLVCTSDHLTAFSKTVLVAPTFIDPLNIDLFANFFDNPVVVTVVIVVWMIYFFLVHWARQKDKSDFEQIGVIYCSDNVVTDSYTYIICISTGWWKQAGTTANVYIYLKGTENTSLRKNLKTPVRKCFQTGYEDWFLITTEHSLGNITSVTLWHDNLGPSPHWFVNQVFVKDIHTDSSWTFVYNDWLAVDRGNLLMTTVTLQPVTEEELKLKKKFNFIITSTQNLRDGHIWISIFSKPACNTFTRVQRLTCCLSLLLTTMLTNLMFYGIPTDEPEDQLVTGGFKLSLSQIVIGIESSLIMFPVNFLIVQLFLKVKQKPESGRLPIPIEFYLETIFKESWETIMTDINYKLLYLTRTYHHKMKFFIKRQRPHERTILETVNKEIARKNTGKTLPWWFIYIAWSVSMTTCITSSYFVALYGLKYGYTRSIEWLVSFFTGFFQSVFIQQPLKVFGIAFLLTLVFKKTASFGESVPEKKEDHDDDYLHSVCIKAPEAHQLVMEPLPKRLLDQIKERLKIEWLINITLRDLVFHIFYMAIVLTMVHGHRNILGSFRNTQTVRSLFVTPSDGKQMEEVLDADDFKEYLHDTLIPAMSDIMSDHEYATQGSNHYLVGTYRLRQLRIKTEICQAILSGLPDGCKEPYSVTEEDTSHYDQSWSTPWTVSGNASFGIDQWKYRSTWDLKTLPYPGAHGTYSGGGYVLELPDNVSLHSDIFSGLFSDGWIDDYTRAVFIEFTLYNPNVDLFTVVVYLFEFTNIGRVFPMNHEFTSSLYHYSTDYQIVVAICEILFVCLTFLFIFVEVKKLKHIGKRKYFSDFWTFIEITQIALSISLLGLFIKRFLTINNTLDEFKDSKGKGFVNFYLAIFWDFVFGYVSGTLVALVTLKTVKHVRYNKRIKTISATLARIRPMFIGYGFMFTITTISFSMLGYTLFGYYHEDFKTVNDSWVAIIIILLGEGDFLGLQDIFRFTGPVFIVAVIMTCQYGLMVMMITILNVGRLEAKHELSKKKSKFALLKYIKSKVKLMLNLK